MDNKLVKEGISTLLKSDKASLIITSILLVVIIVLGFMMNSKDSNIEKLEYALAVAVPETTFVNVEYEILVYEFDTVTIVKRLSDTIRIADKIYIIDTIYVEKEIRKIIEPFKMSFEDDSNDWVILKGSLMYPSGNLHLEYRNKKLKPYKDFNVIAGIGWKLIDNRPFIGADFLYKKIGLGIVVGKDNYGLAFKYRL